MAYTQKSKIFGDAENDGTLATAGGLPTSTPAPMATAGGGTPATKQAPIAPAANQPTTMGPGTGFVNMDRLLGANTNIGDKVTSTGTKLLGKEGAAFDAKATDATNKANAGVAVNKTLDNDIGWAIGPRADQDHLDRVLGSLNTQFTGPTSIGYDFGAGGGKEAGALANSGKATGQILAQRTGTKIEGGMAGYNPNVSALDRALYGTAPGAIAAREGIKGGIKAEQDRQGAGKETFQNLVGQKTDEATAIRDSTRAKLQGEADKIIGAGTDAMNRANSLGSAGPAATLENFLPQDSRLSNISKILNDPSLDRQSQGSWNYSNPNAGQGQGTQIDLMSQFDGQVPVAPTPDQYEAARKSNTVAGPELEKMYNQMVERQKWEDAHPEYVTAKKQTDANAQMRSEIEKALGIGG